MYVRRVVNTTRLEGSIPGGVEIRGKEDSGGRRRGGRGMISSVLGGVLSSLVELQERMDGITSSFTAKASDIYALARTWRRRPIGDSQLCCLRFDGIVEEDTTMCLLDEGDHRSP
jgi:hypothetical protein